MEEHTTTTHPTTTTAEHTTTTHPTTTTEEHTTTTHPTTTTVEHITTTHPTTTITSGPGKITTTLDNFKILCKGVQFVDV